MSVLSSTRADPEHLYAVLRLLETAGRGMSIDELRAWIQPGLEKFPGSILENTLGVGRSLGFIGEGKTVELKLDHRVDEVDTLADLVHRRLATCPVDDPDAVLFQTFAWFVIKCEQSHGTTWIDNYGKAKELADEVDAALCTDEPSRTSAFNDSKLPSWKNWINFVGLGCNLGNISRFYPFAYRRLKRELARMSHTLGWDRPIEVGDLLCSIAEAMPYLDGGCTFQGLARKMRWTPDPRRITHVLSAALRELHDLGEVEISSPGDASDAYEMAHDPYSRISNAKWITLKRGLLG